MGLDRPDGGESCQRRAIVVYLALRIRPENTSSDFWKEHLDTFETAIAIRAPIETAYTYLADFTRHGEWSCSVKQIEQITEGAIRVGTELRASETIPARFHSYTRVSALEPPRFMAWAVTDHRVLKTEWEFELAPIPECTQLTQRARFEGLHWLGRLLLWFLRKPNVLGENRASLERIKAILESKQGNKQRDDASP